MKNTIFLKAAVVTLTTSAYLAIISTAQAASFLSTSAGQIGTINTTTGVLTPVVTGSVSFTDIALSEANQLYGVTFSQLYIIDQITNTSTLIGNTGTSVNALGFDNINQLYAAGGNQLSTINITTGNATFVNNLSGYSSAGDIVFDPVNNRFLGTSGTPVDSTLFSINPSNGVATQIGSIGFGNVFGLFFENGILFGYTE